MRINWSKKNYNWFEDAYDGIPSHDNDLESLNWNIKDYYTFSQRLTLPQFLACHVTLVFNWYKDRHYETSQNKLFIEIPPITTSLWTNSFDFAWQKFHIISSKASYSDKSYSFSQGHKECNHNSFQKKLCQLRRRVDRYIKYWRLAI